MYLSIDLIKYLLYNACMDKFSALADPNRRKIIELLAKQGQLSATQIYEHFQVSPQAISQHLKVLREANLVQVEKRAQQRIYRIDTGAMLDLEGWARNMRQLWDERFDALEKVLEAEKNRLKEATDEQE
jgi:DNA-binding transcriptional ArsR family regulator